MSAVYWYASHDAAGAAVAGAPSLSGIAGSLIALLDACLVNGYGATTLTSLVVSGGVATATVQTGHPYLDLQQVLIAGATPSALNGVQRITRTSSTTFTFSTVATGTATGTITAKLAPAGWSKEFAAATKAVYRATDVQGRRFWYRIDDTGYDAALRGYRSMTDVDSGSMPFPAADTVRVAKLESGAAPPWVLIADAHGLYLFVRAYGPSASYFPHAVGDLGRLAVSDVYCSCVAGWGVAAQGAKVTAGAALCAVRALSASGLNTAGLPSGWNAESAINAAQATGDGGGTWLSGLTGPAYPAAHGGALVVPLHLAHDGTPRGRLRGLYALLHASGWSYGQQVDIGGGRVGLVIPAYQAASGGGLAGALVVALSDWEAP